VILVPEGPNDRSQAVYCLGSVVKHEPSREGRYDPISSGVLDWDPESLGNRRRDRLEVSIHTVLTGRTAFSNAFQAVNCLATIT
jgi:hypothetical protein